MIGITIYGQIQMMGDNNSTVINFYFNSNNLKKKHNYIAYHCTRKAVAAGVIELEHIPEKHDPADILTKTLVLHNHELLTKELLV